MALNLEFAKKHWLVIASAFLGVWVLYYIFKHASGTAPAAAGDISSAGNPSINSGQLMAQAQLNAQVETTQIQGQVANSQIAAQLASEQQKTAAELAATLAGQQVDLAKTENTNATAIGLQHIVSDAAVTQTQIQGTTLQALAKTVGQTQVQIQQSKNQVELAQISDVDKQISNIMTYSKHAGSDLSAIAPVIYAELGQGTAGASVAQSNAQAKIATGAPAVISAASSGIASILTGLFA